MHRPYLHLTISIGRNLSRKPFCNLHPFLLHSFKSSFSLSSSLPSSKSFLFSENLYDGFLQSCNGLASLKQIHSSLATSGFIFQSPHLGAKIIIKYSKFGDTESARSLFNDIRGPNSFLWNTMIRVYANGGRPSETLELYLLMRRAGVPPNNYTFPFVLKACASKSLTLQGKLVHADTIRTGFVSGMFVEAGLVDMYAKCGLIDDGRRVFDRMPERDLVCWTAMITAYEQSERPEQSLELLHQMQREGLYADSVTTVSVASALGQLGDAKGALSVHAYAIQNAFLEDVCVANSIIAMYAKCGIVENARLVFDGMNERDGISWNSMLSCYTQNGQASEALLLFDQMIDSKSKPNPVTALIMVNACAYLGSGHLGKKLHNFIIDSKLGIDTTLWNALMDMYAKCGDLDTAVELFKDRHPSERDVSSWNVLIAGYGIHGHGKEALTLFSEMQQEGIEPNHITFASVLSACSHAGLIDEGKKCFADMTRLCVKPEVKHYACMVDMLGRAGLLKEAFALIKEMPSAPNDGVWGALLLACRIHGNTELGEIAANNLFQLEPEHTGYYVLMSNIYAVSNKWQEVGKLRQDMKSKGLKKPAAFSVIEFGKDVHGFHTADQLNPYHREVYRKVESLAIEMKMAGHVPDLSCVLHDVEDEDKEQILNFHSEKLAVAFGLMKIDPGMGIQDKRIMSLDIGLLMAGAKERGELEERVTTLLNDVKKLGNIILFIDEVHTLVGSVSVGQGNKGSGLDISNLLKPSLGRGELQCIASTTLDEYRTHFEKDKALARRFQPVLINEPSQEDAVGILLGLREKYEAHHKCKFTFEALSAAVHLSARYIPDRYLPDKAIDLIDEAGSKARIEAFKKKKEQETHILSRSPVDYWQEIKAVQAMHRAVLASKQLHKDGPSSMEGNSELNLEQFCPSTTDDDESTVVGADDIAKVASLWSGIPIQQLTADERMLLVGLDEQLRKRVVGQDEAVSSISRAITRSRVGLKDPDRPIAVMLFCGPTGVGKTELAKALAACYFGSESAMLRLDMSEYMERHTVSKLLGSPPGYVGYGEGETLTEAIRRRPFTVVLFDEIEKAHPDIFNILLQVFEDGHLTDSQGRRVSFKNALVVMTSNVGSTAITKGRHGSIGFLISDDKSTSYSGMKSILMEELKAYFRPELLNRIDEVVFFRPLEKTQMLEILNIMLRDVKERLITLGIGLEVSNSIMDLICQQGYDKSYGARPLRRAVTQIIEDLVSEALLAGEYKPGDIAVIDIDATGNPFVTIRSGQNVLFSDTSIL